MIVFAALINTTVPCKPRFYYSIHAATRLGFSMEKLRFDGQGRVSTIAEPKQEGALLSLAAMPR